MRIYKLYVFLRFSYLLRCLWLGERQTLDRNRTATQQIKKEILKNQVNKKLFEEQSAVLSEQRYKDEGCNRHQFNQNI